MGRPAPCRARHRRIDSVRSGDRSRSRRRCRHTSELSWAWTVPADLLGRVVRALRATSSDVRLRRRCRRSRLRRMAGARRRSWARSRRLVRSRASTSGVGRTAHEPVSPHVRPGQRVICSAHTWTLHAAARVACALVYRPLPRVVAKSRHETFAVGAGVRRRGDVVQSGRGHSTVAHAHAGACDGQPGARPELGCRDQTDHTPAFHRSAFASRRNEMTGSHVE